MLAILRERLVPGPSASGGSDFLEGVETFLGEKIRRQLLKAGRRQPPDHQRALARAGKQHRNLIRGKYDAVAVGGGERIEKKLHGVGQPIDALIRERRRGSHAATR